MTNNIKPFITRAALTLAIMLTAATGWAEEVLRGGTESDPVEITTTADIITTKYGTYVGYFVVNENTTITHQVWVGYGENSNIYISIPTGKTLTVEVTGNDPGLEYWDGSCALHVYGGGTLVVSNGIKTEGGTCDMHNITINGAHYDDDGYLDGSIHTVTFNSKGGTAVASQTFGLKYGQTIATVTEPTAPTRTNYDFSGWYKESSCTNAWDFASDGVTADVTLYAKWTPDPAHFSQDGDTYTIHTAGGWNVFCDLLADNTKGYFDGKTVQLGADITVSRMAGADYHDFTGTFDGGGHTLTFSHTATGNYCAPFRNVQGATAETPAVISNLNVVSTVTADDYRHPAGLIALQSGHVSVTDCNVEAHISNTTGTDNPTNLYPAALVSQSNGVLTVSGCTTSGQIATDGKYAAGLIGIVQNTATIENCRASVTIQSSTSGDGTHGGLVASQSSGTTITITGCLFDGRLLGSATNKCGGFIGWRGNTATIYNSLFAPAEVTVKNDGSATFARNDVDTYNCYYTTPFNDGTNYAPVLADGTVSPAKWHNGKATRTVAAAADVTIEPVALTGTATQYTVSGITAYSGGGLQRGETLYYGSGDQLSLTLSNSATAAPQGYQYGYTASAGTLSGNTLTMPDEDVTISTALAPIDWATVNQGNSKDPYMIYNKDQLLLLAHRVNGTNGETAVKDGYYGKYFKLGADITFTHDADEPDDYAENYEAIGTYIGGTIRYFNGMFDGDSHTVSGIRIRKDGSDDADSYQGLFGFIDGAQIHDVHLTDARITGYKNVGGIAGYINAGSISGCSVTDSYITSTHDWIYGTICGFTRSYSSLTNNYYHDCTVNGTPVTSGMGCNGADITANNGALPAYAIALGANITTPPGTFAGQKEWLDTPPVSPRLAPGNGFTLAGNHYFASGYVFTPGSTLASGAAQGYTPRATLGGQLLDLYTPTGDNDLLAGKAIARLTVTADCDGKTLAAALRSDGQAVTVAYINADGTADEASAIALDGTETSLAAGTYFAGLPTVQFDHTLTLTGNVTLILCDGCEMNVGESGSRINGKGIDYNNNAALTVFGQTEGTGALNAYTSGSNHHAVNIGYLTVNGGNITADTDGSGSFAIYTTKGYTTINGGTVNANGNTAGIYACANVNIYGGNVNATGTYGICASNGKPITLGWTKPTDRITASSYTAQSIYVASGKMLHNGTDYLSGTLGDPAAVNGKTLRPAANTTYTTADGTAAQADAILLDGSDTSLPAGNYLATGTLNYTHGITLTGNVTLILADNCHMNVGTSGERIDGKGIAHSGFPTLTITSEANGSGNGNGALNIYTTGTGHYGIITGAITINGGNVTADTDGYHAVALYAADTDLTINGGTVSATTAGTTANAIYAFGNYTFSWRTPADRITIGATGLYATAAKTATFTRLFTDATGNYYGATLTGTALNALKGVTLEAAETADFTVTLAPKGYGTYYDGHYDITLPAGTQARIVTARGGTDGTLDYETIADGDDGITLPKTVPAGTAVMLCHDDGGPVTLTVNDADIDTRDFTDTDGNTLGLVSLLHGSDVTTETTGGTLYYKLTYGSATGHESIFGWYWGSANGAAFESPAHKAWLALPAAEARSFIGLPDFDEQTGITTTNYTNDTNSAGAWYTLDGRKLDGTPMKSGIYVNNGKKVIIK